MARGLSRKTRAAGQVEAIASESVAISLDIEIDEDEGLLRIYDPRAFHAGRRGFCRRCSRPRPPGRGSRRRRSISPRPAAD